MINGFSEDEIIQMYVDGCSSQNIALIVGVNYYKIQPILHRSEHFKNYRKLSTRLPHSEIVESYKEGVSKYRLAKDYGVAEVTINRILVRHGVK